jgi:hypothetical protein
VVLGFWLAAVQPAPADDRASVTLPAKIPSAFNRLYDGRTGKSGRVRGGARPWVLVNSFRWELE